jgi:hypothetical protein
MGANIFSNSTKSIPTSDAQIVRVSMEEQEIGGRKSNLPGQQKSPKMGVEHVGTSSSPK